IPLILILDSITDIRNFGAIVRTAECAGVHAIVIPLKGAASINADAVKSSAGALNTMLICREKSIIQTITFLKQSGIQIVAATEKVEKSYYNIDFSLPTAIVLGSEDLGIHSSILENADYLVKIPLKGKIESLNVSVASGILLFEAIKQRQNL
ncbi:MAG: 23S rRNA (guanosine(2251)-2'-O)-methyltransferase RlmB, partial [Bacteroidetes bacterium CG_4_8_14_3_um_filter_31_14]